MPHLPDLCFHATPPPPSTHKHTHAYLFTSVPHLAACAQSCDPAAKPTSHVPLPSLHPPQPLNSSLSFPLLAHASAPPPTHPFIPFRTPHSLACSRVTQRSIAPPTHPFTPLHTPSHPPPRSLAPRPQPCNPAVGGPSYTPLHTRQQPPLPRSLAPRPQPCNPAVGGPAKSQLVHEVDALGGEIGRMADRTYLQKRVLNRSKGPAVWALRAQTDKLEYAREMRRVLETEPNLELREVR
eukprot:215653-Chlamydomonas_euryale.AAC.5